MCNRMFPVIIQRLASVALFWQLNVDRRKASVILVQDSECISHNGPKKTYRRWMGWITWDRSGILCRCSQTCISCNSHCISGTWWSLRENSHMRSQIQQPISVWGFLERDEVWLAQVQVEAVRTGADAVVSSLHEVQTRTARWALITAAAHARLAERRALLTALLIVPEKASRALRYTHPERQTDGGGKRNGERQTQTEEPHETRKINIWQPWGKTFTRKQRQKSGSEKAISSRCEHGLCNLGCRRTQHL